MDAAVDPSTLARMIDPLATVIAATSVVMAIVLALRVQPRGLPLLASDSLPGQRSRRASVVSLLGVGALLVSPPLAFVLLLAAPVVTVLRRRSESRRTEQVVITKLAEVVDLFAMSLASGDTAMIAVDKAITWAPAPFDAHFAWCSRQVELGRPLGDALEDLPGRVDAALRPLTAALVAHDRHGAPIVANLAQLARDVRADQRRRAEAAARRLPVALLFPLVTCVLPAFLLLTVVPVVADTVTSFDLFASP